MVTEDIITLIPPPKDMPGAETEFSETVQLFIIPVTAAP
jgi:hypothetical protein